MSDLIVVLGATASGKTQVALRIAERLGTEIISADARQMYRGFRIATAAPSQEMMKSVPHHFIESESPLRPLSAGSYAKKCLSLIRKLFQRYDQLVLVGGSGLYVRAVCEGIATSVKVPEAIRKKWRAVAEAGSLEQLQSFVAARAPKYYAEMDRSNPHRLARAAELIESQHVSLEELRSALLPSRPFRVHKIGLSLDREQLYLRIEERCADMLREGLWAEAEALYKQYGPKQLPPTIGYTETFAYFEGKYSRAEAEVRFVRSSKQYAKRQLTWLRNEEDLIWFPSTDQAAIDAHVDRICS